LGARPVCAACAGDEDFILKGGGTLDPFRRHLCEERKPIVIALATALDDKKSSMRIRSTRASQRRSRSRRLESSMSGADNGHSADVAHLLRAVLQRQKSICDNQCHHARENQQSQE